jgi:hypothetical protein
MSLGKARNHGCRISDAWTVDGMRTVILENELLRVVVVADKGTDITEFRYKPRDLDYLLFTPNGLRNPAKGVLSSPTDGPFLDYYSGGWNDILPNGGPASTYKGAEFGQHGEVSLIPWEYAIQEDTEEEVAVKFWVRPYRTPFFVEKVMRMQKGQAILTIEERVTNEAGEDMHLMWGQHIALGRPFLDAGAVIDVPAKRLLVNPPMPNYEPRLYTPGAEFPWPKATGPDGLPVDASQIPAFGSKLAQEMAYILELTDGWYAVTNQQEGLGFGVRFDHELYRYIWYWQQLGNAGGGYPWWSRLHTVALEPWTGYPTGGLAEAIANNTAVLLTPGQTIKTTLRAIAYTGSGHVSSISPEGIVRFA